MGAVLGSAAFVVVVGALAGVIIIQLKAKAAAAAAAASASGGAAVSIPIVKEVTLGKKLGEGNFGEVYQGKAFGGEDVAIKRLKEEFVEDFLQESTMLAKIRHVKSRIVGNSPSSPTVLSCMAFTQKKINDILLLNFVIKEVF